MQFVIVKQIDTLPTLNKKVKGRERGGQLHSTQTHKPGVQLNPGGLVGPSPAPAAPVPNLAASLLMTCCTRGLFWYLEMLAGLVATSWKAADTSGS